MCLVKLGSDHFLCKALVRTWRRSLQGPYKVLTGPYILNTKMLLPLLGSKISKIVPGILRVIHRDASIGRFFSTQKKITGLF